MKIIESFLTNNDCYKQNRKLNIKGLMIHSIGTPQPKASVIFNQWNKSGVTKAVHGFIEPNGVVYQTLPWTMRGWHAGGIGNNSYIGVEITEPSSIKYTKGSQFIDNNPENTKKHVLDTYKTAVFLFAYLCKEFKLDPLQDGVVISHSEGFKRGVASNHGDIEHIWFQYGLTMDKFRKDIKEAMTPKPVEVFKTTTANVNFREKPNLLGKRIMVIKENTKVKILEPDNKGWTKVKFEDKQGYVSSKYLI